MDRKMFSLKRFLAIIKKEFIQVKRDPISLRLPFAMPIIMMLLFGYAVNTEVDNIPTVVFDQSKSAESREYIDKFVASNYFTVKYYASSEKEMSDLIDGGKAKAGLIIPADYAVDLKKNKTPQTQLIIDGTDPTTARTALNSGLLITEVYAKTFKEKALKKLGISSVNVPGISLNTKVWYNPNLESNRFTIPGLVGLILQNITIMLTAFALVREKERSTIEQLIVTPIRSAELILGKLVPYVIIGYAGFLFALSICLFWFRVEAAGSLSLLLLLGFLFVYCSLSIGMLISTFANNQMQAMMVMILVLLPSILLSGFIFPREAMPAVINWIGYAIPLTYFLDIIRGIMLKGVGIDFLWNDVIALCIFTVVILTIAIFRFRKSLD
ncbi:MAG: ABC transporter permease [Clostridiales bacterium]|jgi:ABC-2 type transport system permease protein|nr:ABC transporter permease [Eubacteriales bacterium]MDH7565530.1 ABC transporter permease [Clostridiales bacterium]